MGAKVIIASRKSEVLQATRKELNYDDRCDLFVCNIREEQEVKALFEFAQNRFQSPVDFLVNNGGGQFPSPAESISANGWRSVVDLNLTGTFLCCKEAFVSGGMKKSGGSIVNIICEMSCGFPNMSHTGAARAGVQNLTKSLAVEWASNNVRVNCVAPGVIFNKSAEKHYSKSAVPNMLDSFVPTTPARRLGTVEEVSSVVCFLLSPGAQYVSGVSVDVGGAGHLATESQLNRDHVGWEKYEWQKEVE